MSPKNKKMTLNEGKPVIKQHIECKLGKSTVVYIIKQTGKKLGKK